MTLNERIEKAKQVAYISNVPIEPIHDLLTDCQSRIAELEKAVAEDIALLRDASELLMSVEMWRGFARKRAKELEALAKERE